MVTNRKDSINMPGLNASDQSWAYPYKDETCSETKVALGGYTGETLPLPHVAESTLYPGGRSLLLIMAAFTRVMRRIHHALTSCPECDRPLGQDGACPFCDRYQSFDASAFPVRQK